MSSEPLRTRYLKCDTCGYPHDGYAKVVKPLNFIWRGEVCPMCGKRMTVHSAPLPKGVKPLYNL